MSEKLTPIDVQNHSFTKKLGGGYDAAAVDAFKEEVAKTLEELYRENEELKQELRSAKDRLADYQRIESTLRETLTTAQEVSEEIKSNAHKEAEAIIARAELEAEKRLRTLETRKAELIAQIHELKQERIKFETKLESLIELHKKVLDAFREEEQKVEKIEETLAFVPKVSKG